MKINLKAALLIAMCASPAAAYDGAHDGSMPSHEELMKASLRYCFNRADTNHDGRISQIEAEAYANTLFREADTNHDNVVTFAEFKAAKMAEMKLVKLQLRDRASSGDMNDRDEDHDDPDQY